VKVCAYFRIRARSGSMAMSEYAKRAATKAGTGFTELDNGFASTEDPARLQQL
jgi:hypothetical protein